MFVEKVRRDADADQVDLIGHSLGGLIGWWYLSRMGGEETIRRLVAMGTPFGGTEVARIGMGGLEAEMLPGSATIRALRVGGGKLRKRVTSIFSTDDALVVPHTRARFPGGRNIKVRNTGHLGLLYSREVFAAIENALSAQGPPSRIGKRRGQPPDDGTQPPRRDSRLPRTYL